MQKCKAIQLARRLGEMTRLKIVRKVKFDILAFADLVPEFRFKLCDRPFRRGGGTRKRRLLRQHHHATATRRQQTCCRYAVTNDSIVKGTSGITFHISRPRYLRSIIIYTGSLGASWLGSRHLRSKD
jgi:hypothetical protein